jgi:uncharacterized membrane protein YcaP (DUF421 family)
MELLDHIWGETGQHITILQMSARALVTFIVSIILLRISGRRSFGMKTPFDITIVILTGAIMAQGVVAKVDYSAALIACLVLAVLHRLFAYFTLRSKKFGSMLKGDKLLVYKDGQLYKKNMMRGLVSENDLMERARIEGHRDLSEIAEAYMERNGEISIIRKD